MGMVKSFSLERVNHILFFILTFVFLYYFSVFIWKVITVISEESDLLDWTVPIVETRKINNVDVNNLTDIFGIVETKEKKEVVVKAPVVKEEIPSDIIPESQLNLKLKGVLVATLDKAGLAIIENRGKQTLFGVGDYILQKVILNRVYGDRIIIDNNGREEAIMLEGERYNETIKKIDVAEAKPPAKKELGELVGIREDLLKDPGKLTDYIYISPVRTSEGLKGFRINPGKDRSIFFKAGLQPNDLAVSLNGYDLTDLSQATQIVTELTTLSEVSVVVERDGQLVELMISLP